MMPSYFFNIHTNDGDVANASEMTFSDDDAAKREGEANARELSWQDLRHKLAICVERIEVTNRDGVLAVYPILTGFMADAVRKEHVGSSTEVLRPAFLSAPTGLRHELQQQQQSRDPVIYCKTCGSHMPD